MNVAAVVILHSNSNTLEKAVPHIRLFRNRFAKLLPHVKVTTDVSVLQSHDQDVLEARFISKYTELLCMFSLRAVINGTHCFSANNK